MTELLALGAVTMYGIVLALLMPFAAHRLTLLWLARRRADGPIRQPSAGVPLPAANRASRSAPAGKPPQPADPSPPRVTVQLPVFNEKHVVERLIDAACRLSHPRTHLQIQVLDDSTDETTLLARRRASAWRRRGVDITVHHRKVRTGYKAGALAAGLESASGEYILILDADFVPGPDLLEALLPSMADGGVGMVQARWDHLNEHDSWLTRAQALLLDGHFFLEQRGRYLGGRFFNFNGTAGLWRRQALVDAGGWQSDTLTEDLDISYRAQMAGWRFVLRDDVGVPAELPATPASLLVQQRRWAQGGVQTARKLLPRVLRGPWRPTVRFESFVHLCGHLAHPLTFGLALLVVPAALGRRALGIDRLWWLDLALFLAATAPFIAFYWTAARRRGRAANVAARGVAETLALAAGLSVLLSGAVLRGLGRSRDPFHRTPKAGSAARSSYETRGGDFRGRRLVVGAGAFMVFAGAIAVAAGHWGSLPFVGLFAAGYLAVGLGAGAPAGSRAGPAAESSVTGSAGAGSAKRRGEVGEEQRPHGDPDRNPVPERLRPDPRGLVGGEPPVAEECEAA